MDIISLQEAIADLNLELFLTFLLIIFFTFIGIWIGRISLRREIKDSPSGQQNKARSTWINNFLQGISTELFGAVLTTIGFGVILVIFQQYQTVQAAKDDLILQMGSPDNSIAIEAVRIARHKGWLEDGTFEGADLTGANLMNANLFGVNFSGANMFGAILVDADLFGATLVNADLSGATLTDANLFKARLMGANLREVNLAGANLVGADLMGASLTEANFVGANLEVANLTSTSLAGANLTGANLASANLEHANLSLIICDKTTVLPNSTQCSSDTDWFQFGAVQFEDSFEWLAYLYKHGLLRQIVSSDEDYENYLDNLRLQGLID